MTDTATAGTRCQVRLADLDDLADAGAYLQLLDQYARDPMGGGVPLAPEVRERLIHDLARHPTALILLAFDGERAVGLCTCFLGYSTFRARPLLNVHDIAVLEEYRGLGIGRALLRTVEQQARELGCCKITLEVREDNPVAHRLYLSEGFSSAELGNERVQYLFLEKRL